MVKEREISTAAVIGAGTMGALIAGEFARAGCSVRLSDVSEARISQGLELLDAAQKALIRAHLLTKIQARAARARIRTGTRVDWACEGADLVVEAVAERLSLKKALFRQFDRYAPPHAILATNTSGLSITDIAAATSRRDRVAGLHFWNPPHIIPLVEVIRGRETSDATAARLMAICRRLGKRPILIRREVPGFVGNRLQFAVLREALHLLETGVASAEDIDTAMTAGPGLRWGAIGPLRTADLGGLDIFCAISRYLFPNLARDRRPPPILRQLVRQGRFGAKTGHGFYPYPGEERRRILARRDRLLLSFLKTLKDEGIGRPTRPARRKTV